MMIFLKGDLCLASMKNRRLGSIVKGFLLVPIFLLCSSCGIVPRVVSEKDQFNKTVYGLSNILNQQKPASNSLSLPQAIARAIKYNMEKKVAEYKLMVASGRAKAAWLSLSPKFNANYNRSSRNNDLVQNLVGPNGELISGESSTVPRNISDTSLVFHWSILDFGMSYLLAKEESNQVLIAMEEERKITQKLVNSVISTYLSAWIEQEFSQKILTLKDKVAHDIEVSNKLYHEKLSSESKELDFQKYLIEHMKRLSDLSDRFSGSKIKLAQIINAAPNSQFKLTNPMKYLGSPVLEHIPLKELYVFAIMHRPELAEALYAARISHLGVYKSLLSILPRLDFSYGYEASDNKFLLNSQWMSGSFSASLNILDSLISAPTRYFNAKLNNKFEHLKLSMMGMVVLSELGIAYKSYLSNYEKFFYSAKYYDILEKIHQNALKQKKSNLMSERSSTKLLLPMTDAHIVMMMSLLSYYDSLNELYNSLGIDLVKPAPGESVSVLSAQVSKDLKKYTISNLESLAKKSIDRLGSDKYASFLSHNLEKPYKGKGSKNQNIKNASRSTPK